MNREIKYGNYSRMIRGIDLPYTSDNDNDNDIWVCLKMLCTPKPNGYVMIIIPMKNCYFIGNIPNIFSYQPI